MSQVALRLQYIQLQHHHVSCTTTRSRRRQGPHDRLDTTAIQCTVRLRLPCASSLANHSHRSGCRRRRVCTVAWCCCSDPRHSKPRQHTTHLHNTDGTACSTSRILSQRHSAVNSPRTSRRHTRGTPNKNHTATHSDTRTLVKKKTQGQLDEAPLDNACTSQPVTSWPRHATYYVQ